MPDFKTVSLVLFHTSRLDQQIWQVVQLLGRHRVRAEVLVVNHLPAASEEPRLPSEPPSAPPKPQTSYRPLPTTHPHLSSAIAAASFDAVLVVEPDFEFAPGSWELLDHHHMASQQPQLLHTAPTTTSRSKAALARVAQSTSRLLLGTRKLANQDGAFYFSRSAALPAITEFARITYQAPANEQLTQLIAMFAQHKLNITETALPQLSSELSPHFRSRTLFKTLSSIFRFWWNGIRFPQAESSLPCKTVRRKSEWAMGLSLVCLAALVLFSCLNFPLFEPDEARNSQLALNAIQSGNWMALTLADENYWDKPPLQIWAIATSYSVFGVSPLTTRLPIALASLMTVALTLLIGKRLIGFRAASIASLLLMMSLGFVVIGRYVTMDSSLTLFTTATFLLSYLAVRHEFKPRYALAAGVAIGLGILTKGPVIVALCLPPLVAQQWLVRANKTSARRLFLERSQHWLWFVVPAALIPLPWFIATASVHPEFVKYFLWEHHVVRFSNAFNHRAPFYYYLLGIFLFTFPASYFLPATLKYLCSRRPEFRLLRTREQGFLCLAAGWVVLFFTLSESKLPTYILPAFPMLCLLLAGVLERRVFSASRYNEWLVTACGLTPSELTATPLKPKLRNATQATIEPVPTKGRDRLSLTKLDRVAQRVPWELGAWIGVLAVGGAAFFRSDYFPVLFVIAALTAITLVLGVVRRKQIRGHGNQAKYAWVAVAVFGLAFVTVVAHRLVPAIAISRSIHVAAAELKTNEEFAAAPVVFYGREDYGARLTLARDELHHFKTEDVCRLADFLQRHPTAILVSSKDSIKLLRKSLPWTRLIEKVESGRHLYACRPHTTAIAREQRQREPGAASLADSVVPNTGSTRR